MDFRISALARVFAIAAGAILLFAGLCTGTDTNSLKKGSWAMQFQITDDFNLDSFQGSTLSLKKHTSDGKAWRMGMTLDFSTNDREDEIFYDDTLSNSQDQEANGQYVQLSIQRVFYSRPGNRASLFYGLGPMASYRHTETTRTTDTYGGQTDENDSKDWSAGLAGFVGVEWFATESISILAEYGAAFTYHHSDRTTMSRRADPDQSRRNESETHGYDFDPAAIKLGLSVYF